jgi:hypothetical protein
MKKIYLLFVMFSLLQSFGQQIDSLYAISYKTLPNPDYPEESYESFIAKIR